MTANHKKKQGIHVGLISRKQGVRAGVAVGRKMNGESFLQREKLRLISSNVLLHTTLLTPSTTALKTKTKTKTHFVITHLHNTYQ